MIIFQLLCENLLSLSNSMNTSCLPQVKTVKNANISLFQTFNLFFGIWGCFFASFLHQTYLVTIPPTGFLLFSPLCPPKFGKMDNFFKYLDVHTSSFKIWLNFVENWWRIY